jgi:hypothetical protein
MKPGARRCGPCAARRVRVDRVDHRTRDLDPLARASRRLEAIEELAALARAQLVQKRTARIRTVEPRRAGGRGLREGSDPRLLTELCGERRAAGGMDVVGATPPRRRSSARAGVRLASAAHTAALPAPKSSAVTAEARSAADMADQRSDEALGGPDRHAERRQLLWLR